MGRIPTESCRYCVGECHFIDRLFRFSCIIFRHGKLRHKTISHDTATNNTRLAPMRACLCLAPTAHLMVLRESWTARAPHAHRAQPKTYPTAHYRLYNQGSLHSDRKPLRQFLCCHRRTLRPRRPLLYYVPLLEWKEPPDLPPDLHQRTV